VTNAHVVAGEQDTTVEVGGRPPGLSARPLVFDPTDDVAVLGDGAIITLGVAALKAANAARRAQLGDP